MNSSEPNIHSILHNIFKFENFLPGQENIIRRIINGNSCLAVFPTGQGKSLCYQLSGIILPGITIVVSPLVALMKDQVDFLISKSIKAARLDSTLTRDQFKDTIKSLVNNELKLLFVAPERFSNERFLQSLKNTSISMMVVDEVHCISEWGHNFRPDYLKLSWIIKDLQIPQTLGLTATATPKVVNDILQSFSIHQDNFILTGFYRNNLTLRFTPSNDPMKMLLRRLESEQPGATIIYVTLQSTAEKVAKKLCDHGYNAQAYHAGMNDEKRHFVQDWFMAKNESIVVATIAFGMGIDKPNIRYVYHYNLAKSLENYAQEIGRAGRDGKPAVCETLGSSQDLTVLKNFVYGDTPESAAIQRILFDINQEDEQFSVSIYQMSQTYDTRNLVLNTLLTYLELENIIVSTGPFYTNYKFIPQRSSAEIFSNFNQERVNFLTSIFSCAKKGSKWFSIDIEDVISNTGADRKRIVSALNYLEEEGEIILKVAGAKQGYRIKRRLSPQELGDLTVQLVARFNKRELNDISRINQVVSLINHSGCQTNFLLDYFGEHRNQNCGHCGHCLDNNTDASFELLELSEEYYSTYCLKNINTINNLLAEDHDALKSPRQLARFLCGIRSPQSSRAKLSKHESNGIFSMVPFEYVLKQLNAQM